MHKKQMNSGRDTFYYQLDIDMVKIHQTQNKNTTDFHRQMFKIINDHIVKAI